MQESNDGVELVERVAALDIGKADLVACVRVPHDSKPGRRVQEVRTFPTTLPGMLELRDWARCWGVSRLAMESTSDYWKAPYPGGPLRPGVAAERQPRQERARPAEDRL
jgi:transposase